LGYIINREIEKLDTFEAIKNRRSIRQQKSDKISAEILNKVLEAARWAPSWANTQTWRFIVVTDKDLKAQLSAASFGRPAPPPGAAPAAPQPPPSSPLIDAPVVIAVCSELNKAGARPDGTPSTDKGGNWYMYDAGLATQNLCLAAHALGLGTVILGAFDAKKTGEILKVPEGYAVVVLVPLGYPAQPGRPPTRKELSEIVFNNTFGSKR
jgi:nitroreductase